MHQHIKIHQDWDSVRFHCPACGAIVMDDQGYPTDQPCEHVLFSWISEIGEFLNPAEELRDLADDEHACYRPSDDQVIERLPDTAVLFEFRSYGMACGPVSLSIMHAIRFPLVSADAPTNIQGN